MSVYNIARTLQKRGHSVAVYTWKSERADKGFETVYGINVYRYGIRNINGKIRMLKIPCRLFQQYFDYLALQKLVQEYDLLHVHAPTYGGYFPKYTRSLISIYGWANALKKVKKPSILTFHKTPSKDEIGAFLKELRNADMATSVSKPLAKALNIEYIPDGVDTDVFKPISHQKDDKFFNIIYPARIEKGKKQDLLVKVIAQLNRRNVKIIFVGPVSDKFYYTELMKKIRKLNIQAIFMEAEYLHMPKVYNMADLVVFTAEYIGLPLGVLEAMACGKPVIALKHALIADGIKNNENVLLVSNEKELKIAMQILLEDEEKRKKIGQKAREFALSYDWKHIVKRYEEKYVRVLEK